MSRRAITAVFLAALTSFVLAFTGAGCGDDGGTPTFEGAVDSGRDAINRQPETGGPETGPADTGADTASATFNVVAAASTGRTGMTVTFDAPPDPASAVVLANYVVPGLTLSGTPMLSGSTVTLVTAAQVTQSYTLTVSNVTRASDGAALSGSMKVFQGSGNFSVMSATAPTGRSLKVTFDAPPHVAEGSDVTKYSVPGLTLSAPVLAGKDVTFTTTPQLAQTYTVTVTGVTRALDDEPLTVATADFTGRLPFNVVSAVSTNPVTLTVTFDGAPNVAKATTLANYVVPGLVLSGVPVLVGNVVTIKTAPQLAQAYTLTVSNVTRASDAEPLDVKTGNFNGTPVLPPTVTNVVVNTTNPNNGTTAYNTGTATVTITGTDFLSVSCAAATIGVKLDDLNGIDAAANTAATACTVDSDTQITATFPTGIRTNGATGWNVKVTNAVATNATSDVKFVPVAGLLISEVYTGTSGNTDHEYVEIYNATGTSLDTSAAGLNVRLHFRSGVGGDTNKTLTKITTGIVPSHGFGLFVSSVSVMGEAWYANRDYTFSAGLVGNGGVYISLSATDNLKVLDKVGWGTQPAGGFEGTASPNVASDMCIERKPAAGAGHATDTDSNVNDWNAPTNVLTPRGIADGAQP